MTANVSMRETNFAAVAVELMLAEREVQFDETSFAVRLEAMVASKIRAAAEITAAEIGLSPDATRNILEQWETRARLIHRAHEIIKALIPHEELILRLIAVGERKSE